MPRRPHDLGVRSERPARRLALALIGAAAAGLAMPAAGSGTASLAVPEGDVLLRVTGQISRANVGGEAHFDDSMLAALPQIAFRTGTIWTAAPQEFSGPALRAVLDRVGASGRVVIAIAANDYRIAIEIASLEETAPIIARRIDGRPFGLRDRGPLWIIFPFDDVPRYRNETSHAQSVWQLTTLVVTDEH